MVLDQYLCGTDENTAVINYLYVGFFYLSYRLLLAAWAILSFLWRMCIRRRSDFVKKYAKNGERYSSWVVVTGGSDGIGLELCKQHAQMGFNICMVARNEKKMQEKLEEVKACVHDSQFQCKYVIADFGKMTTIEPYHEIASQMADLDIAMVYLNAGYAHPGPLSLVSDQQCQDQVTLSALHPLYLTKAMLKQLLARPERSAIIATSSVAGIQAIPGIVSYSASKSFMKFFAQALHYEVKDKIDVLAWLPGFVTTKMTDNRPADCMTTCSTVQANEGMMRDIGKTNLTYGHFKHWMTGVMMGSLPMSLFGEASAKNTTEEFYKLEAREAQQKADDDNFQQAA